MGGGKWSFNSLELLRELHVKGSSRGLICQLSVDRLLSAAILKETDI